MPAEKFVLACSECGRHNYVQSKNRATNQAKIKLNKYCPKDRKHTEHVETRLRH